jgi:hypothetical protein
VAVHQHTHPDCTALIAKGHTADRQILIQKDCDATDNAFESLTEKDLVTKANTMLDLMGWEGLNKPRNTKFLGVKKLCGGSILYQMNSADVAMWLRDLAVQKSFMANFGGTLNIRNKLCYVIAEFILTTFEAGSSFMHAKLEDINFLSRESIVFSKYIKPPHL